MFRLFNAEHVLVNFKKPVYLYRKKFSSSGECASNCKTSVSEAIVLLPECCPLTKCLARNPN